MRQYIIVTIVFGSVLAIIVWVVFNLFTTTTIETPAQTYAVVTDFKSTRGSGAAAVYEYTVEGKPYSFWGYNNYTLIVGDKFALEYDVEDPEEKVIFYDRPVFLEKEETQKAAGKISRIKWYWKEAVHFRYEARGKLYERVQALPKEYKKVIPDLAEGKEYQVEYWNQDPQRAIVHLDKPL